MSLLAWKCEYEGEGGDCSLIVFAETEEEARKAAVAEDNLDSEESLTACDRAPEFDEHAVLGYVPAEAMCAAGWWLTCSHCEHHVTDEGCHRCADDEDSDEMLSPVFRGGAAYCSQACLDAEATERKAWQEKKAANAEHVLKRWPGAEIVDCSPGGARFRFPGGLGSVRWNADDLQHVYPELRDVDAFKAFDAQCAATKHAPS